MTTALDSKQIFDLNSPKSKRYLKNLNSPWKIWFFLLFKLPSAIWWGFRVKTVTKEKGEVTLPFNWRTQNPYKSIYFAAQAGAAEFSTAVLVNLFLVGRPDISVLVLDFQAEFLKKANTKTTFTCEDSQIAKEAIQEAIETGEGKSVTMKSIGRNTNGEVVSKFYVTWTFKKRKS